MHMSLFYIHFHKTVVESSGGSRWSTEQSTQWCHLSDWVCVCVCVWKSYAMALEPLSPRWKIFSSFLGPLSYSSKTHTHTRKDVQVVFCICVVLRSDCVLSRCHNSTWTNLLFFFFLFFSVWHSSLSCHLCMKTWRRMYAAQCLPRPC